nr:hypothetical protein BHI3_08940 [Bacteriovorax sp. HI3]
MPKKVVIYKKNGINHEIEMSWGIFFRNFIVYFDGKEIGRFQGQKHLDRGEDFLLPNGETLRVKKTQKIMTVLIEVFVNGEPLEGTDSDPAVLVEKAYKVAIFLCGLNLVVGLLASFFQIDFLIQMGFGWYNLIMSILYFVPIFIGYKTKSWVALCFVLVVFLLDTVNAFLWIVEMGKSGRQVNGGSLVVRLFFGVPLFLGAKAGFLLKDKEQEKQSST